MPSLRSQEESQGATTVLESPKPNPRAPSLTSGAIDRRMRRVFSPRANGKRFVDEWLIREHPRQPWLLSGAVWNKTHLLCVHPKLSEQPALQYIPTELMILVRTRNPRNPRNPKPNKP